MSNTQNMREQFQADEQIVGTSRILYSNTAIQSEETSTIYSKTMSINKFNYKNSYARSSEITVEFYRTRQHSNRTGEREDKLKSISYVKRNGNKVAITNIIGIVYGTQTTTFNNVKDCNPWLCVSLIKLDRTYDFQFDHYYELIWFLYKTKRIYHNIPESRPMKIYECLLKNKKNLDETYRDFFKRLSEIVNEDIFQNIFRKRVKLKNCEECSICLDQIVHLRQLKCCTHNFCKDCIIRWAKERRQIKQPVNCPLCRKSVNKYLSFS